MSFIDIRLGDIPADENTLKTFAGLLNRQELDRANAFKNSAMRGKFIAVRGLLRTTLAAYLHVEPNDLQFGYGEHGKPALIGHDLYFNLSHTSSKLAIAVSDLKNIGIDIEEIRPRNALPAMAGRCFSAREFSEWNCLPVSRQLQTFYQLWTKKEAFVKAVGHGIALGLDQCEVDMQSGLNFLKIPQEYGAAEDWKIIELPADQGFCGALVAPNVNFTVKQCWLAPEIQS